MRHMWCGGSPCRTGRMIGWGRRIGVLHPALWACLLLIPQPSPASDSGVSAEIYPYRKDTPALGGLWCLCTVDFGPVDSDRKFPGAIACDGARPLPYLTWRGGMVRAVSREDCEDLFLCDFLEGEDATLVIAVDSLTSYRVVLTLGDPAQKRGPMNVFVNDEQVAAGLEIDPGEPVQLDCAVTPRGGHIRIRLAGVDCGSFAVDGASIYVSARARPLRLPELFPAGAPASSEGIAPVVGRGRREQAKAILRQCCEYLVAERPGEGCFSYSGSWYESAYPIRTLLVSSALLDQRRYREAALDCLDRFVTEQHPDGGWSSQFFGSRACPVARATREAAPSRNLADVGTMAFCLSLAWPHAGAERRATYLRAAALFADSLVLPNQLPSGAFPNLQFAGVRFLHPYSVATGVQAANLSALYGVTRSRRYLVSAQRAALFLARSIQPDGSVLFYRYNNATPETMNPDRMGELYYVLEGLIWNYWYADGPIRAEIRAALDRYFSGPGGIRSWPSPAEWMAQGNTWENSKRAGVLFLVSQYATMGQNKPELSSWMDVALEAFARSETAQASGVRSDPAGPAGRHAMAATGFAGLGLASLVRPGLIDPGHTVDRRGRW